MGTIRLENVDFQKWFFSSCAHDKCSAILGCGFSAFNQNVLWKKN